MPVVICISLNTVDSKRFGCWRPQEEYLRSALGCLKTGVFAEWYADQRFCHPGVLATPDEAAQAWSLDAAHSTIWQMVTWLLDLG